MIDRISSLEYQLIACRDFFQAIVEHSPKDAPVETLTLFKAKIKEINDVLEIENE